MDLATVGSAELEARTIEKLESEMLSMPQADCPVAHIFGPGVYIRQVSMKAGTFAVGHKQKFEHLNVILSGAVAVVTENGVREMRAPLVYVGKPGRKVGYVLEDCVWLNVYATNETDIETLERTFIEKGATFREMEELSWKTSVAATQVDRDDYSEMLREVGITESIARAQSENEADQIAMPEQWASRFTVRASPIEGRGAFLSESAQVGEYIAPARINGKRTPAGRFVNHAALPNAQFVKDESGDIHLIALREIRGCAGGSVGEEITVNYRQALSLSGIVSREV